MGYSGNNGPEQLKAIRNLKGRHAANSFKNLRKRTELKIEELHVDRPSPAVMAAIRADIEAERKRRNRWIYGVMAACIAVLFSVFYYLDATMVHEPVLSSMEKCGQLENVDEIFECHMFEGGKYRRDNPRLAIHHYESALAIYPEHKRAREGALRLLVQDDYNSLQRRRITGHIAAYKEIHGETPFILACENKYNRLLNTYGTNPQHSID